MTQIISGKPGDVFVNETSKCLYQFHCNFRNSCGVCASYDGLISNSFPIPLHWSCSCFQTLIRPGGTSQPFTDYRKIIAELDTHQQSRIMGVSNYKLVETGTVEWSDIVTTGRVRDLREVVSLKRLSVKQLTAAGIDPRTAETAYQSVHTAAHELASAARKAAFEALRAKGISNEQIKQAVGERLAAKVSISVGPSGPQASRVKIGPPPLPLGLLALEELLGVKFKPDVPEPKPPQEEPPGDTRESK